GLADRAPSSPPTYTAAGRSVTIESLRLSFELPASFEVVENEELVFLARSFESRGVLSIQRDTADVVRHEPEGEESVAPADIEGVDAVVVTDAVLAGLPAGVAARELLVANRERSFTVILSAAEPALPRLWDDFISSVRIAPG
ncbi:MAG TPA: hypothetical protein VHN37_02025, partial [Actinomycetota bacterium]|nr:hypothetical protein [Actinomycetota bacterium]